MRGATLGFMPFITPSRFQPTRPLRGATPDLKDYPEALVFQPTRPLRGATTACSLILGSFYDFNPRAPCGARPVILPLVEFSKIFQPTRPLRGATQWAVAAPRPAFISTHAPLAGRDAGRPVSWAAPFYFNPRAPCGARLSTSGKRNRRPRFQPTRPLRGATLPCGSW